MRTGCEILSSGSGGLGVQKVNVRLTAGYALNPRTRLTTAAPNTHRAIVRSATLASLLRGCLPGLRINEHLPYPGDVVFRHACKMGLEGIVSKRLGSRYISGRSRDWLKFKNPEAPAVKREAEEDWGRQGGASGARSTA